MCARITEIEATREELGRRAGYVQLTHLRTSIHWIFIEFLLWPGHDAGDTERQIRPDHEEWAEEKDKQTDVSIRCDTKWTFPKSIWEYVPGVQEGGVEATQMCKWKVFNSYWHDPMYIYVTVNSRKTDDIVQGEWEKGPACETSTFKRKVKEDEARSQTA